MRSLGILVLLLLTASFLYTGCKQAEEVVQESEKAHEEAKEQYEDSPYAMPIVSEDRAGGFDRVHVSLLSQKARSCTSVIFLIEDGRVSRRIFSPD